MNILRALTKRIQLDEQDERLQWLTREITPDTAETEEEISLFNKMLPTMQPGDKLWLMDNSKWDSLGGRAGYCLVRDGVIIASEVLLMN